MKRSLIWKTVLIGAVVALSVFLYISHGVESAKKMYPERSDLGMRDYLRSGVRLGLDLRGGMHLVLQVVTRDALKAEADQGVVETEALLREKGATGAVVSKVDDISFAVELGQAGEIDTLRDALEESLEGWSRNEQGSRWLFTLSAPARKTIEEHAVTQSLETIRNRIDEFGVSEPVIQRQENDRIVIQLPGIDDPARAKKLIGAVAQLELKIVEKAAGSEAALLTEYGGAVPPELQMVPSTLRRNPDGSEGERSYYVVKRVASITGRDLKRAAVSKDEYQMPAVSFNLNAEGAKKFRKVTGDNIGRSLAIILDNRVQSAPKINSQISDSGIIQGDFSIEEATDLALVLRAGALPAGLVFLEERTVGPSLGLDSIRQGVTAAIVGSLLVFVFMILYYRLAGVNAVAALILNVILLMGALAMFDATLTLPGIAGIVLTVGMAVDSNVLIFERIREELRRGKTVRSAIEAGFSRALATVIDTHLTTLISSLFLFQFGTGPIKGFAVTLVIGIIASLYTAFFASKVLFEWIYYRDQRVQTISI